MTSTESSPRREADEFDTDLDHHSAEFAKDPLRTLSELQSRRPVAKSSHWGGFWLLTGYDVAFEALHTPELFSSRPNEHGVRGVPPQPGAGSLAPIDYDQPEVGFFRSFLLSALSPGAVREMQPIIEEMTNDFIDQFIERGTADVSDELFTPLPAQLMLRILGLDASRWAEWVVVGTRIRSRRGRGPRRRGDEGDGDVRRDLPGNRLGEGTAQAGAARRAGRRRTRRSRAQRRRTGQHGVPTDPRRHGHHGWSDRKFVAAHRRAARLRKQILADPSVLDQGTEEFLRCATPALGLPRTVTEDTEFHGRQLKKGEQVLVMYAAANRDPSQFDDPETIDLSRKATRHMAFGLGVHRCLGSNLARAMFKTMITELLTRAPDLAVRTSEVVRYDDAASVYAVRHLPITFTPGQRKSSKDSLPG